MKDDVLIDDSFFITDLGTVQNEITIKSLNRSLLMQRLTCRASNSNLTFEKSILIDLNCELIIEFFSPPFASLFN